MMNYKSVQFKSAAERKRDAEICKHYRAIGIPAVVAATALKAEKRDSNLKEKSPKK